MESVGGVIKWAVAFSSLFFIFLTESFYRQHLFNYSLIAI